MNVIATQPGYYADNYKEVGDRFALKSDKDFSKAWMKKDAKPVKAPLVSEPRNK